MKIPQLKKKSDTKSCHNISWEDDYSWVHQADILEVLKDNSKLNPEVRKYLEDENNYTEDLKKLLPLETVQLQLLKTIQLKNMVYSFIQR